MLYRRADRRIFILEDDVLQPARSGWGYSLQAGYMLTDRWELAGRYAALLPLGQPALPLEADWGRAHEIGGGTSLYFHGHVLKVQADHFYVRRPGEGGEKRSRVQLQASF